MTYSVHSYGLNHKLVDHPIVSHLYSKEKKIVGEMTLNMIQA